MLAMGKSKYLLAPIEPLSILIISKFSIINHNVCLIYILSRSVQNIVAAQDVLCLPVC